MITVDMVRVKEGEQFPLRPQQKTPSEALSHIAWCDFGFGGRLAKVEQNDDVVTVITHTSFFGCIDIGTYKGPEAEMRLIVKLAGYVYTVLASKAGQQALIDLAMKPFMASPRLRRPFFVNMAGGMLIGEKLTHYALAAVFSDECYGEDDAKVRQVIEASYNIEFKDLIAAYEIAKSEAIDLIEAIALAAPRQWVA